MSKVDWSKAPEGAEFYGQGLFWREELGDNFYWCNFHNRFKSSEHWHHPKMSKDYEQRPHQWPDETRIDIISTNGNDGEHYMKVYPINNEQTVKADELLSEGLQILTQRGEQYGSEHRECSFPQAAEAFNAITGHNLKGSDICLILALLKQVRQYARPRYHHDSVVDGINYLALHGQELAKERK